MILRTLARSARYVPLLLAALIVVAVGPAARSQNQAGRYSGPVETAVFAAGCFWCVEQAFDKVEGVVDTISGFTGGSVVNPTYDQVSFGNTGHAEAVQVKFNPAKVSYAKLLETYWHNVDPFDGGGQFCDRGPPYKPYIFTGSPAQEKAARESKLAVEKQFERDVAVKIRPLKAFYPAEDYHQNYHQKNPARYAFYKWNCGRAQRLKQVWGEPQS